MKTITSLLTISILASAHFSGPLRGAIIQTGSAWVPPAASPGGNRLLVGLGAVGSVEINGGSTVTSAGNNFGSAAYVGVDGGTGTLLVTGAGSVLTMNALNSLRVGANASNSTGTVTIQDGGTVTLTDQPLTLGVATGTNINNTGTAELLGDATLNAPEGIRLGEGDQTSDGTLRITGTGNTVTAGGTSYLNLSGGTGAITVESGNSVSFNTLAMQGSDVGSALPAPTGAGTVTWDITDWSAINPIAVTNALYLNAGGGSHLVVNPVVAPAPSTYSLGDTIPLITYGSLTGGNYDSVGTSFTSLVNEFTIRQDGSSVFLEVTGIPEPSRAVLLLVGALGIVLRRRR